MAGAPPDLRRVVPLCPKLRAEEGLLGWPSLPLTGVVAPSRWPGLPVGQHTRGGLLVLRGEGTGWDEVRGGSRCHPSRGERLLGHPRLCALYVDCPG